MVEIKEIEQTPLLLPFWHHFILSYDIRFGLKSEVTVSGIDIYKNTHEAEVLNNHIAVVMYPDLHISLQSEISNIFIDLKEWAHLDETEELDLW